MVRSAVHLGGGVVKIHIEGRDHCKHYTLYVLGDLLLPVSQENPNSNQLYEEGLALINTLHALSGMDASSSDDDEDDDDDDDD